MVCQDEMISVWKVPGGVPAGDVRSLTQTSNKLIQYMFYCTDRKWEYYLWCPTFYFTLNSQPVLNELHFFSANVSYLPPAEIFEPCSHPGSPSYGTPSSKKLHFQAGETLNYSCQTGHQLLGEPVLHCVPGHPSLWSGLPPVCQGEKLLTIWSIQILML